MGVRRLGGLAAAPVGRQRDLEYVVDDAGRLLGVITVDDVLEIALPPDWRRREAAQPPDTRPS